LSLLIALLVFLSAHASSQGAAGPSGVCRPANLRDQEAGCWILADDRIGTLATSPVYWALDVYTTVAAANADKGPRGTVVESLGKTWLLTIENAKSRSTHGRRIAEIGPLEIVEGQSYSAQYMEAIFTPGMTAPEHTHSGPEAWYTEAGETCLETSDGRVQVGRAGGPPVIVPMGLSMHLTATGTAQRRSLVLILHRSSLPPTTVERRWIAKGLCKKP
jgi:quercetin dioxygenase-like cupin family protein